MTGPGWQLLHRVLRPHRRELLALLGISVLLAAPTTATGLLIARALDEGFLIRRADLGVLWLAILVQVQLAAAVLTKLIFRPLTAVVEPFRDHLVTAVVRSSLLQNSSPGATVRQATEQVEQARQLLSSVLRNVSMTLSVGWGALVGLTVLDPLLAAVLLPCLAAAGTTYWLLVRLALRWQRRAVLNEETTAEQATAVFAARRDIIAFAAGTTATRPTREWIETNRRTSIRVGRLNVLRHLAAWLGVDAAIVVLLVLAPIAISTGRIGAGELVAAIYYLAFGLGPALRFMTHAGSGWLISLITIMTRLSDVVTTAAVPEQPSTGPVRRPAIVLDAVTFRYAETSAAILDDVSLTIPYGTHLAVVGPSGAGKSTLAAIIGGLLLPDGGLVRVGGVIAGEMARGQAIALTPQEAYVFAGTLRENLAYLAPGTSDRRVLDTATAFGLADVLTRYALDDELPPNGGGLSAGERQLIALARVYLSAAPIVILDEATSQLDPVLEQRAEAAFRQRTGTLIVIAHRITSARRADQVLLVDAGRISSGTHHQLVEASDRYRELVGHWNPAALTAGGPL